MARMKEISRKRAQDDANSFGILSVPFHDNHNRDNENENKNILHHNIHETMIGRKFQYVTRTGKRKKYVICSYNAENGTHGVHGITGSDNDRDHNRKTKNITMEDLPNIRWLYTNASLPRGDPKETHLYSSQYAGVKYRHRHNDQSTHKTAAATNNNNNNSQSCWNWKAYAPGKNSRMEEMRYVGSFGSEKDAALAHDCYARMAGFSNLNFPGELLYEEEVRQRKRKQSGRTSPSTVSASDASSCASLSSGNISDDSVPALPRSTKQSQQVVNKQAKGKNDFSLCSDYKTRTLKQQQNHDIFNGGDNMFEPPSPPPNVEEIASLQEEPCYAASEAKQEDCQIGNMGPMKSLLASKKRKTSQRKTSQFRGVTLLKRRPSKPWQAQTARGNILLSLGKKPPQTHFIGLFKDEVDAALAFDEIMRKYGGSTEIPLLNFPTNEEKLSAAATAAAAAKSEMASKREEKEHVYCKGPTTVFGAKKVEEKKDLCSGSVLEPDSRKSSASPKKANDSNKNNQNQTNCLSSMIAGDRVAFEFGTGVYFGSIENCNTKSKCNTNWNWSVLFDDGEIYRFDYEDMSISIALYEQIREKEMSDPQREEKLMKIKNNHIAQKLSVETRIPNNAKEKFLKVGFALWQRSYLPVLFIGPYDISPGSIRERWLSAFEKVKKCDKTNIPQIVYWFGTDLDDGFSILQGKECLSFEEGKKRGLLKQKVGSGSRKFNQALDGLNESLKKPLCSRLPFVKLKEDYEHICGPQADRLLAEIEAEFSL